MEGREDRLLTVIEVAEYFRVEPESVRRWLREGKLLGINLGRGPGWRIRLGDLEEFIKARHTRQGQTPPDVGEGQENGEAEPPFTELSRLTGSASVSSAHQE